MAWYAEGELTLKSEEDMADQATAYRSYLLRLWQLGESGEWKASLEEPVTGVRMGFGSIDALVVYLVEETEGVPKERDCAGGTDGCQGVT